MRTWMVTLSIRDGDFEYVADCLVKGQHDEVALISKYTGQPVNYRHGKWYEVVGDYRYYTVYSKKEVAEGDIAVLLKYGIVYLED